MSENKTEIALPEVTCHGDVSSTMKRAELEETSNFKIGSMIKNSTNKFSINSLNDRSEIQVQSSCSPISTTQISVDDTSPKQSIGLDAKVEMEQDHTHDISNADTTTVQGKCASPINLNLIYLILFHLTKNHKNLQIIHSILVYFGLRS